MDEQAPSSGIIKARVKRLLPSFWVWRYALVLGCIAILALHAQGFYKFGFLQRLDAWVYDSQLRLQDAPPAGAILANSSKVVIVDIDGPSLVTFGRWPWSRVLVSSLVTRLTKEQNAKVTVFDMAFAQEESPFADLALAQSIQNQAVVLGYSFVNSPVLDASGVLPTPVFSSASHSHWRGLNTVWSGYEGNLSSLTEAAKQSGFFNLTPDIDNVVRNAPMLTHFKGHYFESLPLAVLRRFHATGDAIPNVQPVLFNQNLTGLRLTQNGQSVLQIDADSMGTIPITYAGKIPHIAAKDVLLGSLAPRQLEGKIVIVGSSVPTLTSQYATPLVGSLPRMDVHAATLDTLLLGQFPHKPSFAKEFELFQLIALSLLLLICLTRLPLPWAIMLSIVFLIGLWLTHFYLYRNAHLILPIGSGIAVILAAITIYALQVFLIQERAKSRLTNLFGSYVSPAWVQQLVGASALNAKELQGMQASNQILTVMFCDMRGFTKISSELSPLAVQALLNDVFSRITTVIQEHGGTIDKYMGDCVMAFWGAPIAQADHAARAVRCALGIQEAITQYNCVPRDDAHHLAMGIGIHTGLMCVGDMGSTIHRSYTVVGSAVNLAARLETISKNYNRSIVLSEATKNAAQSTDSSLDHFVHLGTMQQDNGEILTETYSYEQRT
jgi:adenylate cyclase